MPEEFVLAVVGAFLPPIIDLANRFVPSTHWRFVVSLVICLVLGSIVAVVTNGVNAVLADATIVFTMSQVVYKLWYEKSATQNAIRGTNDGTAE